MQQNIPENKISRAILHYIDNEILQYISIYIVQKTSRTILSLSFLCSMQFLL